MDLGPPELPSQSTATPVGFARRRLLAACSAYAPKWGRLFCRLDAECSGALQEKRFRSALRRLLRVRVEQLSDGEIHDCFEAADRNGDRSLDSEEFVHFMSQHPGSTQPESGSDGTSNAGLVGESEPQHVEIPKSEDSNPVQMRTRRRGRGAAAASPPRRTLKKNKSKRSGNKKKSPFTSPTRQTANASLPTVTNVDDMDYAPVVSTPQSKSASPGKRRSKPRRNKSVLL